MSNFQTQIKVTGGYDAQSNRSILGTIIEQSPLPKNQERNQSFTFPSMNDDAGEDSDPELIALKVQDYNSIFESEIGTSELSSVYAI